MVNIKGEDEHTEAFGTRAVVSVRMGDFFLEQADKIHIGRNLDLSLSFLSLLLDSIKHRESHTSYYC